jgi:hypothetical protein
MLKKNGKELVSLACPFVYAKLLLLYLTDTVIIYIAGEGGCIKILLNPVFFFFFFFLDKSQYKVTESMTKPVAGH